jgi:hypothetical protein
MTDHETILTALADGLTVGKAARSLGIAEAEVHTALRETADNFRNGEHLRETWALEDIRLHRLGLKFFHKAMEGERRLPGRGDLRENFGETRYAGRRQRADRARRDCDAPGGAAIAAKNLWRIGPHQGHHRSRE